MTITSPFTANQACAPACRAAGAAAPGFQALDSVPGVSTVLHIRQSVDPAADAALQGAR